MAFVMETARELAVGRNELLAQISFEPSRGTLGSVFQDAQGDDVDLPPSATEIESTSSVDAIRNGDFLEFVLGLDEMSAQIADGYMKSLIATLNTVTEATGNVFDASGRPNFDVFIEMLEAREWSLTDDDKLAMPSILVNPNDVDKFPPLTPDQQAKLEALQQRKLDELLAARRSRRLS